MGLQMNLSRVSLIEIDDKEGRVDSGIRHTFFNTQQQDKRILRPQMGAYTSLIHFTDDNQRKESTFGMITFIVIPQLRRAPARSFCFASFQGRVALCGPVFNSEYLSS